MKYLKFLMIFVFLTGLVLAVGCGGDDDDGPDEEQLRLEEMEGTWNASSVTLDGDDRTANWANFTLTLTISKTYSTSGSNNEEIWPLSGSWEFAGTEGSGLNEVIRSDDVTVHIDAISETNLDLRFQYASSSPGRSGRQKSIEGEWIFELSK